MGKCPESGYEAPLKDFAKEYRDEHRTSFSRPSKYADSRVCLPFL